jgi:hypothetical protein
MGRAAVTVLLLLAALVFPSVPKADVTPGVVRPLSKATICATVWHLDRRHVTEGMKKQVAKAYDVPWDRRAEFEFDHLVPRSLGGADDVRNLWPQPRFGEWTAQRKDRLEVKLGTMVCKGELDLHTAQRAFQRDWIAAYRTYLATR